MVRGGCEKFWWFVGAFVKLVCKAFQIRVDQ